MSKEKQCFVIMPISDVDGYESGHFGRVYEHIVKPACRQAGFHPTLASEVLQTNYIAIDILKRLLEAEMAICDLSSRNPNVLYELGVRHAFKLPVALIKDERTNRVFDIQGFRDTEYDSSLRIDSVQSNVQAVTEALRSTYEAQDDVNSLVGLLGVQPAKITQTTMLSADTQLILGSIQTLEQRLAAIEKGPLRSNTSVSNSLDHSAIMGASIPLTRENYKDLKPGELVVHARFGVGRVLDIHHADPSNPRDKTKATIFFPSSGQKQLLLDYAQLSKPVKDQDSPA